jgi:hypothetical protein
MDEMMSEVFEALLEAGATEAKAKETAQALRDMARISCGHQPAVVRY